MKRKPRVVEAEWFSKTANGHSTVGLNCEDCLKVFNCHKVFNTVISEISYQWKDKITVGDGKSLANNMMMLQTYRLRLEAFFRTDKRKDWKTVFHGTDGGSFNQNRCGGRLPGIWILKNSSIRRT